MQKKSQYICVFRHFRVLSYRRDLKRSMFIPLIYFHLQHLMYFNVISNPSSIARIIRDFCWFSWKPDIALVLAGNKIWCNQSGWNFTRSISRRDHSLLKMSDRKDQPKWKIICDRGRGLSLTSILQIFKLFFNVLYGIL